MADIDLDFLARQMERLLTEMQGMREEMGSIYAELNSTRSEMANMRDDFDLAKISPRNSRSPGRTAPGLAKSGGVGGGSRKSYCRITRQPDSDDRHPVPRTA